MEPSDRPTGRADSGLSQELHPHPMALPAHPPFTQLRFAVRRRCVINQEHFASLRSPLSASPAQPPRASRCRSILPTDHHPLIPLSPATGRDLEALASDTLGIPATARYRSGTP